MPDARDRLAAALGIVASYTDQTGRRRRTPKATQAALMRAMGVEAGTDAQAQELLAKREGAATALPRYAIGAPGEAMRVGGIESANWRLTCEDGRALEGRCLPLPPLPLGLHMLHANGSTCTLIVAPPRLPLPAKTWGMTAPLYGLAGPGAGLADTDALTEAGRALAQVGGDFLGLNPIHAGFWDAKVGYSPYTPSHRRRLTALHIPTGPAQGGADLLDYAIEIPAKRAALEAAFAKAPGDPGFEAFITTEGPALHRFALHQALSDRHGPFWTDWPAALQDPNSPEARQAAGEMADDIRFHAWLQYRAAESLSAANRAMTDAGAKYGLYLDLAVGTHPAGAETWEDRDSFAQGVSLGAPPDAFSAEGQRWGLAPFNPEAVIAKGFAPLSETLRALFSHAGAVRIDHILGFDRAYWVPDTPGLPGAYVRMPRDAMLAVIRLEAARAGGVVVGEDLGNIPRGLRRQLAASGILGCRLAIFEQANDPPRFRDTKSYPVAALASFSTHDLPTWRGWRRGHEIELRRGLGHISDSDAARHQARREDEVAALDQMTAAHRTPGTTAEDQDALTHALAASSAALVAVQAEITFDMLPQPNLPGTTMEFPNWRQPLPLPAKDWHKAPKLAKTAAIMTQHGRGSDR
jgi:4-alpha-glucanotransferase